MTTMVESTDALPRWDLTTIYPGPDSPRLRAAFDDQTQATVDLETLFDRHGIGRQLPGPVDEAQIAVFDEVVACYNALLDRSLRLDGYLFCLVAADVRDEAAQAAAAEWRQLKTGLARLAPRFITWAGALDLDAIFARSSVARAHAPVFRRLRRVAAHLMAPGEEDLAAALGPSGGVAWMVLRDDLAGRATASIELDGAVRELPLSEIGNLAYNPDRDVRRRAHETETAAWHALGVPLAAAINSVKGQQLTLARRRGWDDPLDQALFANAIDRETLDAMQDAIAAAIPDYQRYLRAKARLLGLPVLAAFDVHAPVGEPQPWPFATARDFIIETFGAVHARLAALAARAFTEGWIDAAPRPGKDGGAFSQPIGGDQSRIFANYLPVYDWMSALAHELGHAYQAAVIGERNYTVLQAPAEMAEMPLPFPMTLAETASTICEALVQRNARATASQAQEIGLLDGWLQTVSINVFSALSLFRFERDLFAARERRELSPAELDDLMTARRREVSGDAIAPETMSPVSWVTPHYYIDGVSFYNFPYAFGMLFALGLLAARDAQPAGFFARLDELLADSGMREAMDLASRFGIDLHDPAFWRASLDRFRADVDRFETLAALSDSAGAATSRHAAT